MFSWLKEKKEKQDQARVALDSLSSSYYRLARKYNNLYSRWNGKFICEEDRVTADKLKEQIRSIYSRWGIAANKYGSNYHIYSHALEKNNWNS